MKGKIVFEEHMAIAETLGETRNFAGDSGKWDEFERQILDLGDERLELMEKNGIELAILSNNAPGVQAILDTNEAIEVAKKANDAMAEAVSKHPKSYAAFAALPMQDPDAASLELTRCINDLGFKGAMVNGFTQKNVPDSAIYYDIPEYRSFWGTVSELDVPFYLHPRMQIPSRAPIYDGHPWLKSSPWGFAVETSIHSLRMCGSGMFDDYPNLKIAQWFLDPLNKSGPDFNRNKSRILDKSNFINTKMCNTLVPWKEKKVLCDGMLYLGLVCFLFSTWSDSVFGIGMPGLVVSRDSTI